MNRKKILAFLAALTAGISAMTVPASAADIFGDINADGAVDSVDAACILQYAAYTGAGGTLDLYTFINGETEEGTTEITGTDKTLTILGWDTYRLDLLAEQYRQSYPDADVEIIYASENGVDASSEFKTSILSGDPIDLYQADADWIRSYIDDSSLSAPLSAIGIADTEYENAYDYAVEMCRNKDGELSAAAYEICPGGYCYNTVLAEQYLGVTSPAEMQTLVSDWDWFLDTAGKLHAASEGSVTIAASYGDLFQPYFNSGKTVPAVQNGVLNMEYYEPFAAMLKSCTDAGYIDPTVKQWTIEWNNAGRDGKTLGYFYSNWCLTEDAMLEASGGDTGSWAIVPGPQPYYWGSGILALSPTCDSRDETARFLRHFTTDADTMERYAQASGAMVNNRIAAESQMGGDHSNPLLGGQNEFAVLYDVADHIELSHMDVTAEDSDIRNLLLGAFEEYYDQPLDQILRHFKEYAAAGTSVKVE